MNTASMIDISSIHKSDDNGFPVDTSNLPPRRTDGGLAGLGRRELAATMTLAIAHGWTPGEIANCRPIWNNVRGLDPQFTDNELAMRFDDWNRMRIACSLSTWDRDECMSHVDLLLEVLDPPKAPSVVHSSSPTAPEPMSDHDALCLELETADCDDGKIVRCHARPHLQVCKAPKGSR